MLRLEQARAPIVLADRRQTDALEAFVRVSEAVTRSLEPGRVLASALERSLEVTALDMGAVYLIEGETGDLVLAASRGLPPPFREAVERLKTVGSILGAVALEARPQIISNLTADPRFRDDLLVSEEHGPSLVAAPLVWEDRVIGVIALGTFGRKQLERADLSFLMAVSRPIAVALGNARLHDALARNDAVRVRLLDTLVTAEEAERRTIAEDIHDDSIQVLTALSMRLHVLRRHLAGTEHAEMLASCEQTNAAAIDRLRNLMFELHPRTLDRDGLSATLRVYLERETPYSGLTWRLDDRLRREPDPEVRATLYRIALEAVANVRKHAKAGRVDLLLEDRDGGVRLQIRDDGVGFRARELEESHHGHLGITAIRERATLAGGWCRIVSEPGRGTTVDCWVPVVATPTQVPA